MGLRRVEHNHDPTPERYVWSSSYPSSSLDIIFISQKSSSRHICTVTGSIPSYPIGIRQQPHTNPPISSLDSCSLQVNDNGVYSKVTNPTAERHSGVTLVVRALFGYLLEKSCRLRLSSQSQYQRPTGVRKNPTPPALATIGSAAFRLFPLPRSLTYFCAKHLRGMRLDIHIHIHLHLFAGRQLPQLFVARAINSESLVFSIFRVQQDNIPVSSYRSAAHGGKDRGALKTWNKK